MSHQTGITANEKLLKVFSKAKGGKIRAIKISIENEQLTCAGIQEIKKDWQKDYDNCIKQMIEDTTPCYILYKFDNKTSLGYEWLLINWIPDTSTVRQKMLYASTKATLKNEFGTSYIKEELHATVFDEITFNGYLKNKQNFSVPIPLTQREEELNELKKTEINTNINIDTRQQTLAGIEFPLTDDTIDSIHDMIRNKSYDYLQFKIDMENEKIQIVKAGNVPLDKLPSEIPTDHARYHLYLFKHYHEGDYIESYVFIYSMPGYTCSVKERMMYSSCKGPLIEKLQSYGIEITKKLEIDNGSELTEDYLQNELHPKQIIFRQQFAKPKGPPNRGAKRLTRTQQ